MNKLKKNLLLIFILTSIITYGQNESSKKALVDTSIIVFKDTVFNLAFDSIVHNLGNIVPTNENNRLVKYFKYVGTDTIYIAKVWTGDPHFICEYPLEPLIPNKIYSFTICFWHQDRQGMLSKVMGFVLSNDNRISLKFTGSYLPIVKKDKGQ